MVLQPRRGPVPVSSGYSFLILFKTKEKKEQGQPAALISFPAFELGIHLIHQPATWSSTEFGIRLSSLDTGQVTRKPAGLSGLWIRQQRSGTARRQFQMCRASPDDAIVRSAVSLPRPSRAEVWSRRLPGRSTTEPAPAGRTTRGNRDRESQEEETSHMFLCDTTPHRCEGPTNNAGP
jgi:hypothetical protein